MSTSNELSTRKQSLFDIDADLDQVARACDLLEGDNELAAAIETYFGDLLDSRDRKLDSYAALIRTYDYMASARKAEAARLAALAQTDENNVKRLKVRLLAFFTLKGITRMETTCNKFSIAGNGGVLPLDMDAVLPEHVPAKFRKTTISIDTDAVRAALDSGETLTWARFRARGQHLGLR